VIAFTAALLPCSTLLFTAADSASVCHSGLTELHLSLPMDDTKGFFGRDAVDRIRQLFAVAHGIESGKGIVC
jgi:hypothetical protein